MKLHPRIPYCEIHGAGTAARYYFYPRGEPARAAGWKLVRLHDHAGRPITDWHSANLHCRMLATIYRGWKKGLAGYGPHMVDELGRPTGVAVHPYGLGRAAPGSVQAIADLWRVSKKWTQDYAEATQRTYGNGLRPLLEAWGDHHYTQIDAFDMREWLERIRDTRGRYIASSIKTCGHALFAWANAGLRADDPNHVPKAQNVFIGLMVKFDLQTKPEPWPIDLIAPFVAFCDRAGHPGMGDYVLFNSWIGQRVTDMLKLTVGQFQQPALRIRQQKTGATVIIPWRDVAELEARFEDMQRRRRAFAVPPLAMFYRDHSGQPWNYEAFSKTWQKLRDGFAFLHSVSQADFSPRWACANYAPAHFEDSPFDFDLRRLYVRTLRHTAVTQLADHGTPVEEIIGITGHSSAGASQILNHYRANTIARARAALGRRTGASVHKISS